MLGEKEAVKAAVKRGLRLKLEDLSNENEKFVNRKVKEYADYLRENMNEGLAILDEDLHDSFITKIEKKECVLRKGKKTIIKVVVK